MKNVTKIVNIKEFQKSLGIAACDFWQNNRIMLGLTIEQTLEQMLACLITNNSFHRVSPETIKEILKKVEKLALEGVPSEKPDFDKLKIREPEVITDEKELIALFRSLEFRVYKFKNVVQKSHEIGQIKNKTPIQIREYETYNIICDILNVLHAFENGSRKGDRALDLEELVSRLEGHLGVLKGNLRFLQEVKK